jgi:Anti-sigma-K factor rskA, C-terminal
VDVWNSEQLMTGDQIPDPDVPPISLGPEIEALLRDPETWVEPDPGLGDRVAMAVSSEVAAPPPGAAEQRSGRWRTLRPVVVGAAAAVVLLFGAVVVLSALSGSDTEETTAFQLVPTGLVPDVTGDIEVSTTRSGMRIDLDAVGLPRRDDGAYYEGWVVARTGEWIPIGTFHEGEGVVLWAGVDLDDVRELTITLEEARPGSEVEHASSGEIVLKAALD